MPDYSYYLLLLAEKGRVGGSPEAKEIRKARKSRCALNLSDGVLGIHTSSYGQNSQPKWACKTRHFGYGIDFFPQNLKSGHRLHRDRSKGNTNPNGRVKREKSGGKSHEMKAKSTRPFGLVIAKI